jgi:hypothetical protein
MNTKHSENDVGKICTSHPSFLAMIDQCILRRAMTGLVQKSDFLRIDTDEQEGTES